MTAAAPKELPPAPVGAAKGPRKAGAEAAFERGLTALAQWVEKEGQQPVPRNTVGETTVDGEAEPVPVKLGVWLSNTNSRRDRLDADQLAALGVAWAGPVPDIEAAPAPFVQAAPPAAPPKQPVREHHEECNKMLYEGGLHLRPHRAAGTALRA